MDKIKRSLNEPVIERYLFEGADQSKVEPHEVCVVCDTKIGFYLYNSQPICGRCLRLLESQMSKEKKHGGGAS